jgi:hypothetical protein
MKRNRGRRLPDFPNLFLTWLKGVWSSLRRFFRRLFLPNKGRRKLVEVHSESFDAFCPLVGLEQFRNAESLTVDELMLNVEWRGVQQDRRRNKPKQNLKPGSGSNLVSAPGMASAEFPICPLAGVERFHNVESLTVGNLMTNVNWRTPKQASKIAAAPSISSVQNEINWD